MFKRWRLQCGAYLIDFVHPVAGKFKHQFTRLYCSGHGSGVKRAGSSLKDPGYHYSWFLLRMDSASPQKMTSLASSRFKIWVVSTPRERPWALVYRGAVAQVGAALPLSDTEAGSRCALCIYTWKREKQTRTTVRWHINLVTLILLWDELIREKQRYYWDTAKGQRPRVKLQLTLQISNCCGHDTVYVSEIHLVLMFLAEKATSYSREFKSLASLPGKPSITLSVKTKQKEQKVSGYRQYKCLYPFMH